MAHVLYLERLVVYACELTTTRGSLLPLRALTLELGAGLRCMHVRLNCSLRISVIHIADVHVDVLMATLISYI